LPFPNVIGLPFIPLKNKNKNLWLEVQMSYILRREMY
jgi:hypothetical protein